MTTRWHLYRYLDGTLLMIEAAECADWEEQTRSVSLIAAGSEDACEAAARLMRA